MFPTLSLEDVKVLRTDYTRGFDRLVDHLVLNGLAAIIAACGLIQGSAAVIIGAMLVATMLMPLGAIGFSAAAGEWHILKVALRFLIKDAAIVFVLAFGIGLLFNVPDTTEILARTKPNLLDLIIAFAGGAAATYVLALPRLGSALVGAAIATALVPPLATSGLLFAHGSTVLGFGAFMLFVTNLVAIAGASMTMFMLMGIKSSAIAGPYAFINHARWVLAGLMALVAFILVYLF